MAAELEPVTRIEWASHGALKQALRALRQEKEIELVCRGWRARVLGGHVPRLIDERTKLGWRDLGNMLLTIWFHAFYYNAAAAGRVLTARSEGNALVLQFTVRRESPPPGGATL